MTKSFIFLLIKKHSGEIDWILPILHKIDNRIRLVTFFNDKDAYNSLLSNKTLYLLWKSRSYKFIFLKNKKNLFFRLVYRTIVCLKIFKTLENKVLMKIYNIDAFCHKLKIEKSLIKACFLTFNNYSFFSQIIKNNNSKSLIIRYPESTLPLVPNFQLPKNFRPYSRLYSDVSLFSKKFEPLAIYNKEDLKNKKILYSGYPRYEYWWVKKFFKNRYKKINKKTFSIFVASRSLDEATYQNKKAFKPNSDNYIHTSIMNIAMKLNNAEVIFKTHPNTKNKTYLHKILKPYPKQKWKIIDDHALTLSAQSDISISVFTSASLDCLATKKPTIEFVRFDKTIQQTIYQKESKKNISIFSHLKLLKSVDNFIDLKKFIIHHYNKDALFKEDKKIKKYFYSDFDSKKIANFIQKNIT